MKYNLGRLEAETLTPVPSVIYTFEIARDVATGEFVKGEYEIIGAITSPPTVNEPASAPMSTGVRDALV